MQAIKTIGLTKYYGKNLGIKNVNLSVDEGDFFGFIGPNGAGKSTTIRALLGLIGITAGRAEVFGHDAVKEKQLILSGLGYLPAELSFYSGMRVREILKLSEALRKKDCSKEAERLCRRLDLDPAKRIDELSLGNRKKVGIVCALQHKPGLYILDEPTSGLDPLIQREFYALLKERSAEGATVFLSSHVLSEVQRYCRHAAIIRKGELLISDSVEKLGYTGAKRVSLHGTSLAPSISGVKDVMAYQNSVSFLYSGRPEALLRELYQMPLTDFSVTEPDLEEIFMHYYAGEEHDGNIEA